MTSMPSEKKFAIRKLVKGQDGKIQVVFVDAKSGQPVVNPAEYTIIQAGNAAQNPLDNTVTSAIPPTSQTSPQLTGFVDNPNKQQGNTSITKQMVSDGNQSGSFSQIAAKDENPRGISNNFGYYNKPDLLNLAGFAPGFIGLAGKAVNTGINASNTSAINSARQALGMDSMGFMDTAKGLISDQKGYIGDISIPGSTRTTPVGFEAFDKNGRTTMTPQEAQARMNATGAKPATKEQVDQSVKGFKSENKSNGLFSSIADSAKGLFSNIFDGLGINSNRQNSEKSYGANEYPEAPSRPSQTSGNYTTFSDFIGAPNNEVPNPNGPETKSQSDQARDGDISGLF